MAAHAASFIGSGIGKSGKPCARLIAPYWFATRVISRITDSVKVLARLAVAARFEAFFISVMTLELGCGRKLDLTNHTAFTMMREKVRPCLQQGGDREST